MKILVLILIFFTWTIAYSQNLVLDIDGNQYKVVKIGNQIWMSENLKVSRYRNGDPISCNLADSVWMKTESGAYTIYNQDSAMNRVFGKIYNWYAVSDPRGLCPVGWHVPASDEWKTLEMTLGMEDRKYGKFFTLFPALQYIFYDQPGTKQNVGGKMKSPGYKFDGSGYWNHKPNGETNESGFSGLPAGVYYPEYIKTGGKHQRIMKFKYFGEFGAWWTSTEVSSNINLDKKPWLKLSAWYRLLDQYKRPYSDALNKYFGMSIRCLKD